jgi:hypothetical protein
MARDSKFLTAIRHPEYLEDELYWYDWRDAYNGGPRFVNRNLKQFSNREDDADFKLRKFFTPITTYAKAAVQDVRNAIFQRLNDVARRDGSENYMRAAVGEIGGVDNKGSSMQSFLGIDVLTELLVMGRVGVYVDMPSLAGFQTMADEGNTRPYCYFYRVEDILSWAVAKPEEPGDFTALLLRDRGIDYNQGFAHGAYLPNGGYTRYRFIWIDPETRKVNMRLFDEKHQIIDMRGEPLTGVIKSNETLANDRAGIIELDLERIPFTMPVIGSSLLKDVYKHQVALLNLGSTDVWYALRANFPIYTEQRDATDIGRHLRRHVDDDGTTTTTDNDKGGEEIRTGVTHGRTYPMDADRPDFINPSPDPLEVSMKLQEKLEDDIRKLVQLAVQNKMGQRAISAEAMKLSDQGLEAGLSYIGLVLERTEREIATHWAAYESRDPDRRQVATIKYPDRYSLKNDEDRVKEATQLADLMYSVPGKTVKRELAKNIVTKLLSGKVSTLDLDQIYGEIDDANYTTSDPETIIRAKEAGLVGEQTASIALGFDDDEYKQAREDHIERAKRVAEAQGVTENAAARGVDDLDADEDSGKEEREEANDNTMDDDDSDPTRGEGKSLNKEER